MHSKLFRILVNKITSLPILKCLPLILPHGVRMELILWVSGKDGFLINTNMPIGIAKPRFDAKVWRGINNRISTK